MWPCWFFPVHSGGRTKWQIESCRPAGIRDRPRRSADGGAMSASVSALLNNPAFVGLYRLAGGRVILS